MRAARPTPRVRVKGCGKSAPRGRQRRRHGKPRREQDRIGAMRCALGRERGLIRWPCRSGWLLEAPGDGRPRGMAVTSGRQAPAIQNPAYRPAGVLFARCRCSRAVTRSERGEHAARGHGHSPLAPGRARRPTASCSISTSAIGGASSMTGVGGLAFLLDLPEAAMLRGGDGLRLEDGRIVEVVAAPEPLAEIRAADALGADARRLASRQPPPADRTDAEGSAHPARPGHRGDGARPRRPRDRARGAVQSRRRRLCEGRSRPRHDARPRSSRP